MDRIPGLIQVNASLTTLMDEPNFLSEFRVQNKNLVDFLCQDAVVSQLLKLMYDLTPLPNVSFKKQCGYAFIANEVISEMNPSLIEVLVKNKQFLAYFFSVTGQAEEEYATAHGYFLSIFKQLISELNPHQDLFIQNFAKNKDKFMMPLVENLNRSNAEVIKAIFDSKKPDLQKLHLPLFEYLLYFYLNEKFVGKSSVEYRFENLVGIFNYLANQNILLTFKTKYIQNLFLDSSVKKKEFLEMIFNLKLAILNYIATTKQLEVHESVMKLFDTYELVSKSNRHLHYLFSLLKFLKTLSSNDKFKAWVQPVFISKMFEILNKYPRRDIIANKVFCILTNLSDTIKANPALGDIVAKKLLEFRQMSHRPIDSVSKINPISLGLIWNFLDQLKAPIGSDPFKDQIKTWMETLKQDFEIKKIEENLDSSDVIKRVPIEEFNPQLPTDFFGETMPTENEVEENIARLTHEHLKPTEHMGGSGKSPVASPHGTAEFPHIDPALEKLTQDLR